MALMASVSICEQKLCAIYGTARAKAMRCASGSPTLFGSMEYGMILRCAITPILSVFILPYMALMASISIGEGKLSAVYGTAIAKVK